MVEAELGKNANAVRGTATDFLLFIKFEQIKKK